MGDGGDRIRVPPVVGWSSRPEDVAQVGGDLDHSRQPVCTNTWHRCFNFQESLRATLVLSVNCMVVETHRVEVGAYLDFDDVVHTRTCCNRECANRDGTKESLCQEDSDHPIG
jgi:hypothetical protein